MRAAVVALAKKGPVAEVACHQHHKRPKHEQAYEMGFFCWAWVATLSMLKQDHLYGLMNSSGYLEESKNERHSGTWLPLQYTWTGDSIDISAWE